MKTEVLRVDKLFGYYIEKVILDQFVFNLFEGEILCLYGVNNSGKSTVLRVLTGSIPGFWKKEVYSYGQPVKINTFEDAKKLGIYCIYSFPSLIENLSLAENLVLLGQSSLANLWFDYADLKQRSYCILEELGLPLHPDVKVKDLRVVDQFLVEIARAVYTGSKILLLDCLDTFVRAEDIQRLKDVLFKLKSHGISICYTNKRSDPDLLFADRAIIIRDGMRVKELSGAEITSENINLYSIGHAIERIAPLPSVDINPEVLQIDHLKVNDRYISFDVKSREIISLMSEEEQDLPEVIQRLRSWKLDCRSVYYKNKLVETSSQSRKLRRNICVIDKISHQNTIFENISPLENIALATYRSLKLSLIKQRIYRLIRQENQDVIDSMENSRKIGSRDKKIERILFFRRLRLLNYDVLIFCKPEQGLDIESRSTLYRELKDLTQNGTAVVIITNLNNDMIKFSNRVFYFSNIT